MKDHHMLYLSQQDIIDIDVPMRRILELMEICHREKGLGYTEMPPKPALKVHPADTVCAMPAWYKRLNISGIKWVGGFENNFKYNLPHICSRIILNDPKNGLPIALMDGNWISAYRTGATSGLAIKYLANPDSEILSIIGCGFQGRTNLEAIINSAPNIKKIHVYDLYPEAVERFISEMSRRFPDYDYIKAPDPRAAVEVADILVTAAPGIADLYRPDGGVVEKGWLKAGCTVAAVDLTQYFYVDVLNDDVDRLTIDDRIQYHERKIRGVVKDIKCDPDELSEVVVGKKPARLSHDEIHYCLYIGLGLADVILADEVYRQALNKGIGRYIPL